MPLNPRPDVPTHEKSGILRLLLDGLGDDERAHMLDVIATQAAAERAAAESGGPLPPRLHD